MRLVPEDGENEVVDKKVPPVVQRRVGMIRVPSAGIWEQMDLLYEIFAELKFVPLRVEHLFEKSEILCVGCSPQFKPIGVNVQATPYRVHALTKSDGTLDKLTVSEETII